MGPRLRGDDGYRVAGQCNKVVFRSGTQSRHCEERSDEAIQSLLRGSLDCFAELVLGRRKAPIRVLAMTENARYPRSVPPVFFVTSATIFAAMASIS